MTNEVLSAAELRARLLRTCQSIIDSCDLLCQADRDLGDGDHGVTMARAFTAAKEGLEASAPVSAGADFSMIGSKLMGAGGTAGIVFGTWFSTLGRTVADRALDAGTLAAGMTAAAQNVQARGKVVLGEKTMFDALSPAVEALTAAVGNGADAALKQAAVAAKAGVDATRQMIATKGKAKTLGERSLGFPDPGAISVALIFEGLSTTA
ncbi:MAG: dhaL [Proteobacteria bacterium]|nr:dhaL [Pseudomonadota bacterium]